MLFMVYITLLYIGCAGSRETGDSRDGNHRGVGEKENDREKLTFIK
jgi:hypothetical protein